MKLATLRTGNTTTAIQVFGDTYRVIDGFLSVDDLLRRASLKDVEAALGETGRMEDADLAPVVTQPGKIICVGVNYRKHIQEMGRQPAKYPTLFTKFTDALIGANDPLLIAPETEQFDWEGELALIMGSTIRRAKGADAFKAIAGYTVAMDGSVRDWQNRTTQWDQGKTWEGSTPLGPVMATPDEVPAHAYVQTLIDGQVMQDGHIDDMVFGPVELVEYICTIVTLRPGDVILTGTPSGVGHARKPPMYVQPGQTVTVAIEGIGQVHNQAVLENVNEGPGRVNEVTGSVG